MKRPWELKGGELKAYRTGFSDGDGGDYFPCLPTGPELKAYDRGYLDGKRYGPRGGKPWTVEEIADLIVMEQEAVNEKR